MAIDDNLKAEAITEIQTAYNACKTAKNSDGIGISMDEAFFMFGLTDSGIHANNQIHFQLVADYFDALEWVDSVDICWSKGRLTLIAYTPS